MLRFILRRLFYGFLVLLGVVILVFFLFNILPGDPARMMLGQRADAESIKIARRDLGLDKPAGVRFLNYINDLSLVSFHNFQGDVRQREEARDKYAPCITLFNVGESTVIAKLPYLRRSYQSKRPVGAILAEAFPQTLLLAVVSMTIAVLLGVTIGTFSAVYNRSIFDRSAFFVSVLGMSLPSFFSAILIAWFFAFLLAPYTGLSMFGSLYTVDNLGNGEHLTLKNLILPALTLGIRPLAVIIELTKSSMLGVLKQNYIKTAFAKGLPFHRVITKHALRNAMNPVVTSVSGWFASFLGGAVFVEYIFDWKGIGVVIVNGLEKYDFPVVMGALLVICVLLVFINIITDICYGILDPRVRVAGD